MPKPSLGTSQTVPEEPASRRIDARIAELTDWRGRSLDRVRRLIHQAVPEVVEEWKWRGVPVWSDRGILCTGETYARVVKLTFARGASLDDPTALFNASREGNVRRAIDLREGEDLDPEAFANLVRAASAFNRRKTPASPISDGAPRLLAGGNPKVAKADGDAPVQAYLRAMPGWTRPLGEQLDALISRAVPDVRKAVRWNSPFYGVEGQGWFASFHVFTHYVKLTFFGGASLDPIPPGGTPRSKDARWVDLREGDEFPETQLRTWVDQAAALPGWNP